jgi:hypothetical protein
MRRQAFYAVVMAVAYGTSVALTGGSLHEAISDGIVLLTGLFFGFALARP